MVGIGLKRGACAVDVLGVDIEVESRGQSPYGFSRDKASWSAVLIVRIGGECIRLQPSALMFHRYRELAIEAAEIYARETFGRTVLESAE